MVEPKDYDFNNLDSIKQYISDPSCDERRLADIMYNMLEERRIDYFKSLLGEGYIDCTAIIPYAASCVDHNFDILRLFIDYGLDIHFGNGNQYMCEYHNELLSKTFILSNDELLFHACNFNNYDVAKYLLELGINPNTIDGACFIVCWDGQLAFEIIKLMLEFGADPNMHNGFPLRESIIKRDYRTTKLLIEHGANPNLIKMNCQLVPGENFTLVDYLLDAGMDSKQLAEILT